MGKNSISACCCLLTHFEASNDLHFVLIALEMLQFLLHHCIKKQKGCFNPTEVATVIFEQLPVAIVTGLVSQASPMHRTTTESVRGTVAIYLEKVLPVHNMKQLLLSY